MAYTFKKRVGPTKYSDVSSLSFYKEPNPFEVSNKTGGNCTWWAWGRFHEVYYNATKKKLSWTAGSGNACSFYRIMKNAGYKVGTKPKPGAIICWGYNGASEGNPGHVAFVEKVNVAKGEIISIEISQSGWSSGPLSNKTLYPGTGKKGTGAWKLGYNNSYFNGFIYNKADFGNPSGTIKATDNGETGDGSKHSQSWYIKKYGNGARVYFLLKNTYKYSHRAACAILGNMEQESGIRTKTGGSFDGNGSEGLCQWTFGRKTKMQEWAKSHSESGQWDSVDGQVSYLVHELKTSYKSVHNFLKDTSNTRNEMVDYFCDHFEVPDPKYAHKDTRHKYAKKWHDRMSGGATDETNEGETTYVGYDMQKRSSQLYSSQNYEYIDISSNYHKESESQLANNISTYLKNTGFSSVNRTTGAIPESILTGTLNEVEIREPLNKVEDKFQISKALIQTPFVEVQFGDYVIGSVKNSLDYHPNNVTALNVTKINGEINQYAINLVHQIRFGEDPNLLDKVFSKVRYGKINIRYGDSASGSLFKDVEAIVTNISQNRDYAGKKISYTVYATSACNYVTSVKLNFPSTVSKPSDVIRKLLYNSGAISEALISVFPGMANQMEVESKGLLPSNDTVLNIDAQADISILNYITFLVGCMSNASNAINDVLRSSTYYLTYEDSTSGAYFKVTEQGKVNSGSAPTSSVYNITIGYPDGNDVLGFNIKTDNSWSILYNTGHKASEFYYDINEEGEVTRQNSPSLFTSSSIMNEMQKNWWTQMVNYPISAQLIMRGLLKPVNLMDYINIDVRFFGIQHNTSGLYVITGQQDILDGSGFKTNLSLLRVGDPTDKYVPLERTQRITKQGGSYTLDTNLMDPTKFEQIQREEVNISWLNDANDAIHAGPVKTWTPPATTISQTGKQSTTSSSSSGGSSSSSTTQPGLISYQFSSTGRTITLKGKSFKSDDKKVATVTSSGTVKSVGAGTCHITYTNDKGKAKKVTIRVPKEVPRSTVIKPIHDQAKILQKWMANACYYWVTPTKASSKYRGTCITFPSVIMQELGLVKSGAAITGSGYPGCNYESYMSGTISRLKKVNANYWSWHKWPHKTAKQLIKEGKVVEGDILTIPSHTYMYAGKQNGVLKWHEAGHSGSGRRDNGPGANHPATWHTNNGDANGNVIFYCHAKDFRVATSCKNGTITAARSWLAGQNVKITYKAASGCKLKSITVDGKTKSVKKHPSYFTFKKIDSKHSIHVEFENTNG